MTIRKFKGPVRDSPSLIAKHFLYCCQRDWGSMACSRLQDIGEKSFSKKKCEKLARAGERQPKSRASYFRFARFNSSPLYYLRAWHKLGVEIHIKTAS